MKSIRDNWVGMTLTGTLEELWEANEVWTSDISTQFEWFEKNLCCHGGCIRFYGLRSAAFCNPSSDALPASEFLAAMKREEERFGLSRRKELSQENTLICDKKEDPVTITDPYSLNLPAFTRWVRDNRDYIEGRGTPASRKAEAEAALIKEVKG